MTGATPDGITVRVIETPTLGDRSYLVHDGEIGFVIDPQRDVDRVQALVDAERIRLTHVAETHIHNDYVTGGFALAAAVGADYLVNAADPVGFDRTPVVDGDEIAIDDRLHLRVVATPGHTYTHLSYVLLDGTDEVAVFSGGSLLYGSTGRPDLLGPDNTAPLARLQHRSARRLGALEGSARLYPTHGFGSFCSATQSGATEGTLADERLANPALRDDETTFVTETVAGLGAWPAYYGRMAPANLAGPAAPDLSPVAAVDAAEIARRVADGEWVVDLRDRASYAAAHAPGTVSVGLDGQFATYLGWIAPGDAPITLLAETDDQIADAQRELVRIGIDRPARQSVGAVSDWTDRPESYETTDFTGLAKARAEHDVALLDVRRDEEHAASHIEGALSVPLHELIDRMDEVPDGEVWVHCAAGYRASIAASLVAAAGRTPIAVDDDYANAAQAGLPVTDRAG